MNVNYNHASELYHFGVKGMKWGVRRYRNYDGTVIKGSKNRHMSDDAKSVESLRKKKIYELSNAELRKLNERKELERKYKSLNKGHIAKGMAFVGTAAGATGSILALYNNSGRIINIGKKFLANI